MYAGFYQLTLPMANIVIMEMGSLKMKLTPIQHRVGGRTDYDLWLINFKSPRNIDFYVKFLASLVVCSEEEAKKRIYAVDGTLSRYTGFHVVISEEMAYLLGGLPLVKGIYRDSEVEYHEDLDGGDLLVDGEVILRPTLKDFDGGRLVHLVVDQILNDIYIRKMDETETEG
ncbi:hypothetical protein Goklo_028517 [Gossypium klotzschianum]|uniref:MORF/ORRM1/DAG-like MORF domain-containing protein n=1 Tax=Gossypium klotzschianum TaxID=34286 RepID=A0A7J8U1P7_9ROSI|nr:hypothetical protein [Gossypium klotzschianum]